MKLYTKNGEIKPRNRIIIIKDGMQTLNPSEEMLFADGWVEYVIPEPTEEEKLMDAKQLAKENIKSYDSSNAVNGFYMNGIEMWLDKATRAGLMLRFEAEMATGMTETSLWYEGVMYTLSLESAFQMLYALELYASQCYDNTQRHLANINGLETIEEVEAYDYMSGYPQKLNF